MDVSVLPRLHDLPYASRMLESGSAVGPGVARGPGIGTVKGSRKAPAAQAPACCRACGNLMASMGMASMGMASMGEAV